MTGNPKLTSMDDAADVLVVDDDRTVAEVVATYLQRAGHRVGMPPTATRRSLPPKPGCPTWSCST